MQYGTDYVLQIDAGFLTGDYTKFMMKVVPETCQLTVSVIPEKDVGVDSRSIPFLQSMIQQNACAYTDRINIVYRQGVRDLMNMIHASRYDVITVHTALMTLADFNMVVGALIARNPDCCIIVNTEHMEHTKDYLSNNVTISERHVSHYVQWDTTAFAIAPRSLSRHTPVPRVVRVRAEPAGTHVSVLVVLYARQPSTSEERAAFVARMSARLKGVRHAIRVVTNMALCENYGGKWVSGQNTGKMMNIALHLAKENGYDTLVFHDHMGIPDDDLLQYYKYEPPCPVAIGWVNEARYWDRSQFGALAVSVAQLRRMNGLPNDAWGCGIADALLARCALSDLPVHIPMRGAWMTTYGADQVPLSPPRLDTKNLTPCMEFSPDQQRRTWWADGLNTLTYTPPAHRVGMYVFNLKWYKRSMRRSQRYVGPLEPGLQPTAECIGTVALRRDSSDSGTGVAPTRPRLLRLLRRLRKSGVKLGNGAYHRALALASPYYLLQNEPVHNRVALAHPGYLVQVLQMVHRSDTKSIAVFCKGVVDGQLTESMPPRYRSLLDRMYEPTYVKDMPVSLEMSPGSKYDAVVSTQRIMEGRGSRNPYLFCLRFFLIAAMHLKTGGNFSNVYYLPAEPGVDDAVAMQLLHLTGCVFNQTHYIKTPYGENPMSMRFFHVVGIGFRGLPRDAIYSLQYAADEWNKGDVVTSFLDVPDPTYQKPFSLKSTVAEFSRMLDDAQEYYVRNILAILHLFQKNSYDAQVQLEINMRADHLTYRTRFYDDLRNFMDTYARKPAKP